nr:vascular endothelial growth factor A-like [Cherax quadricarinatus]
MKFVCLAAGVTLLALAVAHNTHQGMNPGDNARTRREDSRIFFPGQPITKPVTQPVSQPEPRPKPDHRGVVALPKDLDLLDTENLSRLNSISNISEFVGMFDLPLPAEDAVATRFGGVSDTQELASMANCKPELKTVALDLPAEANTMFFPTCVRLEQCGGCCYGPLLTCIPSVTKVVKLKVSHTHTHTPSNFEVLGYLHDGLLLSDVPIFQAVTDEALLNVFLVFPSEEKNNCEAQNLTKYWDNDSCNCYCRRPEECSSGQYFSQISCRCETIASRIGK